MESSRISTLEEDSETPVSTKDAETNKIKRQLNQKLFPILMRRPPLFHILDHCGDRNDLSS